MDAHYTRFTSLWKMYKKNVLLIRLIQNCAEIEKKIHCGFKAYIQISLIYPLANHEQYMFPY